MTDTAQAERITRLQDENIATRRELLMQREAAGELRALLAEVLADQFPLMCEPLRQRVRAAVNRGEV